MGKDVLRNGDVISGAVLAALGAYIVFEASGYSFRGEDGPGPGFFPIWYGVLMIALSLMLMVTTAMKGGPATEYDWPAIGKAIGAWLAFAVSTALMGWVGFLVSFALLTFFMVVVIFRQPPLRAVIVAVCASAGFYIVFPLALGVNIPTGIFGF
ncbi:MAG: tripartite tricarboxylate transporter TctB family protein [Xanthobacteraceae bacterium]